MFNGLSQSWTKTNLKPFFLKSTRSKFLAGRSQFLDQPKIYDLAIKRKNHLRKVWSGIGFTYRKSKDTKILPVILKKSYFLKSLPKTSGRINIVIDFIVCVKYKLNTRIYPYIIAFAYGIAEDERLPVTNIVVN